MNRKASLVLCIVVIACFSGCKKNSPAAATRSFYMGVTPWPGNFTTAGVDTAYQFINTSCDIVSHHFDEGIPYEECYRKQALPPALLQDLQTRKARTNAGKKIFLSAAALNLSRKEKAGYYSNSSQPDSIKNYWAQLPVNDSKIVAAYVSYISWLIDQLQPIYVNYGVESNSALWDAGQFLLYKDFLRQVYAQLKPKYPSIPFFVSFMVDETPQGWENARQLLAFTDFIGLSAYPYVTVSSSAGGNTDPALFPANYFEKFIALDETKPLAFAETGYIAQDLLIPSFSLNKQGRPDWQNSYLEKICQLCNSRKAKLLVWFCSKDYDAGNAWLKSQGLYQDLFGLWQDIGLTDEAGRPRPAFNTWTLWQQKTRID